VQRGDVPERPIGELKNGLHRDRLSFQRFGANGLKLLEHTLAYALVVLHREATAALPEVARAEVGTLRQRLWKVGAVLQTSGRRICLHVSASWPQRELFVRVYEAVQQFVQVLRGRRTPVPLASQLPPM
jgi:Transposase DDE domain group 1